jgi:hypothetical protein
MDPRYGASVGACAVRSLTLSLLLCFCDVSVIYGGALLFCLYIYIYIYVNGSSCYRHVSLSLCPIRWGWCGLWAPTGPTDDPRTRRPTDTTHDTAGKRYIYVYIYYGLCVEHSNG